MSETFASLFTQEQDWLDSPEESPSNRTIKSIAFKVTYDNLSKVNYPVSMLKLEHRLAYQQCRESLWVQAVRNLYKRTHFMELTIEFLQGVLSEAEYERIVTENEDRYVINFRELNNPMEANVIDDIIHAIGEKLNIDEVSELFSIRSGCLYNM